MAEDAPADINVLLAGFRQGWAIPREAPEATHYFVRREIGAAVSVCAMELRAWAGRLYEPRKGIRVCPACWTIMKNRT